VQGLQRSMKMGDAQLTEMDKATLAVLTDAADARGVMRRNDVEVHAGRSFYVARKA